MLDAPIDPQSLTEEIIAVLRACGGPTLRSAVRERCKLAGSADYFSGEFGKLVAEGKVVAAGGVGPRVVYRLAAMNDIEAKPVRSLARTGRALDSGWNRTAEKRHTAAEAEAARQRILNCLAGGIEVKSRDLRAAVQLREKQFSYLVRQLVQEGAVQHLGTRAGSRYRLVDVLVAEQPQSKVVSAPVLQEGLTVRVKLEGHQVKPFFAFLKQLRQRDEVAA